MGKGAPQAPNATETAAATQSANLINQYSPFGSSVYTQTGTGPTGVPTYRQDVSLSSGAQGALDASLGAQTSLSRTAQQQASRLGAQLSQPLDWSAQRSYLNDITAQNLNPEWDRMNELNVTELTNRGLRPGSTAYDQQRNQFQQSRSQAYNSANAANYNNALQSQLALRNQGINEVTGLLGAGQVQTPQFGNTPTTDVAGITNAAYGQQMAAYNANQGAIGGLFSAGASLIPLLSDRRAKTDIERVGTLDNGLGVYLYKYLGEEPYHLGLMADEVEEINSDAVVERSDGMKMVIYKKAVE